MEKTAIDYLIEQLNEQGFLGTYCTPDNIDTKRESMNQIIEQAKEMQKDQKYTEADMLHCWNTLMVAMTHNNPIFFKDYINSLNK